MSTATISEPQDQAQLEPRGRTSFWSAVWIVAEREILVRVRSKAFVISTAIFLVILAGAVIFSSVGSSFFGPTTVATTSGSQSAVEQLDDTEVTVVDSPEAARQAVTDGTVDAAVLADPATGQLTVIGDRDVPDELVQGLSTLPGIELLDPNAPNPAIVYFIGLGFGIVFFMSAMTFGQSIASSVVEEKQTRIVEILLATIPARALLAGKVIGSSVLAFVQVLLCAIVVLGTNAITGGSVALDGLGAPIVWFVALFIVGFVMLSALYAAAASLVSRAEDLPSAVSPVTMLVMAPYFLIIFFSNNLTALSVMSFIPFTAPVAVPMRLYLGTIEWWEPIVSLAILIVTAMAMIAFAAKLYPRTLLRMGKPLSWREALRR